jgi:oxygen-dependent protoporphyrinogen oxidase
MDGFVGAIAGRFERTRAVTGVGVRSVVRTGSGYRVELDGGEALEADAVVVAVPAFAAAEILAGLDDDLAAAHAEIPHASSVIVTFALREAAVSHPLDGYGYVVPRAEHTDVLACTWTSRKWEGRAPERAHLVRLYAGRYGGRDLMLETDDALVALAREELAAIGIEAEPILTRVQRWPRGMPQYVLGHLDRLARIEASLAELPGLAVAGAAYRGVGIPDCIRSGEAAADVAARSRAALTR